MINDRLQPGDILSKDIYLHSAIPFLKKGTVLDEEHITMLQLFFLIENESGILMDQNESVDKQQPQPSTFEQEFMKTLKAYEKDFMSWQAGAKVDVFSARKMILPLVDLALASPGQVLKKMLQLKTNDCGIDSICMAILGAIVASRMQMERGDIVQAALAGYLSDCGLSQLSDGDKNVERKYKKHPVISYKMMENIPSISQQVKIAVLQHHELINGNGFPLSIKGDQMNSFGKILSGSRAVIDFFIEKNKRNDSNWLTSFEDFTRQQIIYYDETVIKLITAFIMNSLKHSAIVLSNGETGEIIFFENDLLSRPLININGEIIALSQHNDLAIEYIG